MRDIILICFFLFFAGHALKKPYIGALLMAWVGFMNPHNLAWGIAQSIPFAALAFIVTLLGVLLNLKQIKFQTNTTFIWIYLFFCWGGICTLTAFFPDDAMIELSRFFKIQLSILLTILVIRDKSKLIALVWTIALSLGFYGVKGGAFSIATFGAFRIWGPGGFIAGNNEIGLAILMIIPLLYFLSQTAENKWLKRALILSMILSAAAVLFTYSRGAFLGLTTMSFFLWLKSDKKLPMAMIASLLLIVSIPFVPTALVDRLNTIETYEQDASAMGRINAWYTAINIANDRITAGGFRHWSLETFALYAPYPKDLHDAHSIYFEVIGELGWIGFLMFFIIHFSNWLTARRIIVYCKGRSDRKWASDLTKMVQVSLIGYYSGGAFLGLAYWDLPYYLMAIVMLTGYIVRVENNKSTLQEPSQTLER